MARPKEGFHDLFAQIPEALWQALSADAERNQRSATRQLVWILHQRYPEASAAQSAAPPAAGGPAPKKAGRGKKT
jgi:hypothetical protein